MKKVPIFLALSCFSFVVSAQQNDFFNIQEFLKKKTKENKPVSKPLIFSKPSFQNLIMLQPSSTVGQNKFSHTLPNGDKVYLLSQDNMPCVTSEINRFDISNDYKETAISSPFTFYNNKPGSMPDAAIPRKIFFSK